MTSQETLNLLNLLIPALVGALGIIVAALATSKMAISTYREQKLIDRADSLLTRRQKAAQRYQSAYRGYVSLYDFDPLPAENDEDRIKAIIEYWHAYTDLFYIASDSVLSAVAAFHKLAWMVDTDLTGEAYDQEFSDLYATMTDAMRKDAYPGTAVMYEVDLLQKLPFNYSPPS